MNIILNVFFQFALFWLLALAYGRKLNDEHTKQNSVSETVPSASTEDSEEDLIARSYGFVDSETNNPIYDYKEPDNLESLNEPEITDSFEEMNEPEKLEETENENNTDFQKVKKIKELSIISLKPKERIKALDPITEQQGAPMRIIRPLRDVSILVRNRHHPVLIARRVPAHWIHRHHHHHHHPHYPKHPHKPVHPHKPHKPHKPHHKKPKHKPCKPCDPKVHKKHHHKPKKPKKKPKKGHCHHPKKPHHKKLIYYAPIPTPMNYYYGPQVPMNVEPNNAYAVEESQEHEDVEVETQKPFSEDIEEDVEEQHRLADLAEQFEEVPEESKVKPVENLPGSKSKIAF